MSMDEYVWVTGLARLLTRQGRRKVVEGESQARVRVLSAWLELESEMGCQPTVRQVAARVGRTAGTVHYQLARLRAEGTLPPAMSCGKRGRWRRSAW